MKDLIVCKFGGSSIASYEDIKRIGEITKQDKRRRVIVVSAPNHTNGKRTTNILIKLSQSKNPTLFDEVINQYVPLKSPEALKKIKNNLTERISSGLEPDAYIDNITSLGDEGSAIAVAEINGFTYIDPKELFLVTSDFSNAKILPKSDELIKDNLENKLNSCNDIFIIPGFSGMTKEGKRATFSRGGSNLTATYIGACLKAGLIENYTDIDGVYSANPKIVNNPRKLREITYDEMRDLSYSGFNVFNHEAVIPAKTAGIPIEIKSATEPEKTGTYIVSERISPPTEPPIIGIAYKNGFCSLDVSATGLNDILGVLAKLTNVFAEKKISVEYVPGGIDDQSFIFDSNKLEGINPLGELKQEIIGIVGMNADIDFRDNLGSIVIAGRRLKKYIGRIDVDIRDMLCSNNINIEFSSQGRKKRSLIYGVNDSDGKNAVNLIYDKYLR